MPLSFGLNVKGKNGPPGASKGKSSERKGTIFDSDPESDDEQNSRKKAGEDGEEIDSFDAASTGAYNSSTHKSSPARPAKSAPKPPQPLRGRAGAGAEEDYRDLASERAAARHATDAASLDASIYDYDSFHATKSSLDAERQAAARQDAIERKPKYMNNLLDAAARRKQDQLVAREKVLQREREAEGDEFADKEKFVTGAYKKQQEEARRIAGEEEERRLVEEKRRREGLGGLSGFYKGVMAEQEERHRQAVEAGERAARGDITTDATATDDAGDSDRRAVEEARRLGREVTVNEEGQITDKRQLLSAGLNIAPSGKRGDAAGKGGADHLRTDKDKAREAAANRAAGRGVGADAKGQRERQTRMLEEQLAATAKRKADEEAEERRAAEHAAKSKKTEAEVGSAKERYLARKREREEAAKKGG